MATLYLCPQDDHCSLYNIYYETLQGVEATEKGKNSSPKKLSADCWLTVDHQSANSWPTVVYRLLQKFSANSQRPTVGSMLVICQLSVSWERLLNTRKASACNDQVVSSFNYLWQVTT